MAHVDVVIDLGLLFVGSDLWRQRVEDIKEVDQSPIKSCSSKEDK